MFQATVVGSSYGLVNNYAIKLVIDAFSIQTGAANHHLLIAIIVFVVAQIGLDVSWRLSEYAAWHVDPFVHRSILLRSYDYVQHHSYRYFQNHPSGTIISKLKGILDGFEQIFANLHHKIGCNFLNTVFSIFSLLLVNTTVFLFMLIWSVLVIVIMYPMSLKLNHLSKHMSDSKHTIMGLLSDNILNIFSLFSFAKRQQELLRIKASITQKYIPDTVLMYQYYFKLSAIGSVLYWIMLVSVFLFMVWLRKTEQVTTGDFVFVMMTTITISTQLWTFTYAMFDFMRELGDFKSACSILETPQDIVDTPQAKPLHIKSPTIQFKEVSFCYEKDGTKIFDGLNLHITAGEKVGLVGHSGAGKSTLISLLLKQFTPTDGHILIDECSLDDITADSLRAQIGLIPQDILLFHRSIGENIGYAKEGATLDEIKFAAKMANIDAFIESLPEQYDTLVGERGVKLSGGQRQRIAIARAILKNAPIIILDEATSSLDTATENEIQQSIYQLLDQKNTTVIAIAHRLSTIRHMDRIVVMDAGQVIEDGTFEDLMSREKGYFKGLWDTQVNGMVL
ncbi:MAG: ABC transporter ATP-binding protein [Legionellales bacterium]|nr:ABC transporter ATP-binding protein [Legionellales bacterium]